MPSDGLPRDDAREVLIEHAPFNVALALAISWTPPKTCCLSGDGVAVS
jgi:hypothetical protein